MNLRNLKFSTTRTFFVLLILGTLLANALVLTFWYQQLIVVTVTHTTKIIHLWLSFNDNGNVELSTRLEFLHKLIGQDSTQISYDPVPPANVILTPKTPLNRRTDQDFLRGSTTYTWNTRKIQLAISLPPEQLPGLINITIDSTPLLKEIWGKEKVLLSYLFINSIILTTVAFFRLRKTLFQPIDKLTFLAENYQVTEEFWPMAASNTSSSEINQLSQTMQAMLERIKDDRRQLLETVSSLKKANKHLYQAQKEIAHADRLAVTGRLAAGFAHEIGNPIAIMKGYFEMLQTEVLNDRERREYVDRSAEELQRVDNLLNQLMGLSQKQAETEDLFDPIPVIEDLLQALAAELQKNAIDTSLNRPKKALAIYGNREQFRQVALNLFLNGIDALKSQDASAKRQIHCTIFSTTENFQDKVVVELADNGEGIAAENLDTIFEPFFTTKACSGGSGLGLSVVHRTVQSLGGTIAVESNPGLGSLFRITLPLATT